LFRKLVPIPVNVVTINSLLDERLRNADDMSQWLAVNRVPLPRLDLDSPGTNITGESAAKSRVGEVLFDKIFREYTKKQWAREASWLNASVLNRIPVQVGFDTRYFPHDQFQGMPIGGYTDLVRRMLSDEHIDVCLDADFFQEIPRSIQERYSQRSHNTIFFTGPIDRYFERSNLPKLEYRSIQFQVVDLPGIHVYQPTVREV